MWFTVYYDDETKSWEVCRTDKYFVAISFKELNDASNFAILLNDEDRAWLAKST